MNTSKERAAALTPKQRAQLERIALKYDDGGAFPLWLSPAEAKALLATPVTEKRTNGGRLVLMRRDPLDALRKLFQTKPSSGGKANPDKRERFVAWHTERFGYWTDNTVCRDRFEVWQAARAQLADEIIAKLEHRSTQLSDSNDSDDAAGECLIALRIVRALATKKS